MNDSEKQTAVEDRELIASTVHNEFVQHGTAYEQAFVNLAVDRLVDADVLDEFNESFFDNRHVEGKRRGAHLNGYSFSPVDGFMNLIVASYSTEDAVGQLGKQTVDEALAGLRNFIIQRDYIDQQSDLAAPCRNCVAEINEHLQSKDKPIRKFRFFLVTNDFVTDQARRIQCGAIDNIPVEALVFDIFRLSTLSLGTEPGIVQIDFTTYKPRQIHCVPASSSEEDVILPYKSYLGVVPGVILADIYDEFGSALLEGNVRSFLSSKGAVNKRIRETILRNPEEFFAFNNGISVTATNVRFDSNGNLDYAEDFQIINGGQTTASLSNARFKDRASLSKINVLMKLTVLDSDIDDETRQNLLASISRASNHQNKVDDTDFFSTHPFHVQLEQWSSKTPAPPSRHSLLQTYWFYERARGQYNQRQMKLATKKQKADFKEQYPSKQKITKQDLAKFRNSWNELPWLVSKGSMESFKKFATGISEMWDKGESAQLQFNQEYFKDSVALAILFKAIESLVSDQTWYTGAYRANVVTYSIALFHHLFINQFKDSAFNLGLIWRQQEVPQEILDIFTELTRFVYDRITDTSSGIVNITQRCKQKMFWEDMLAGPLPSLDRKAIAPFILGKEAIQQIKKEGKDKQKILNSAELQTWVYTQGVPFWVRIQEFAQTKPLRLSPQEEAALSSAFKINSGKIPTEFFCRVLQALVRKCEANGFK